MSAFKKLPAVLSLHRAISLSDAEMFSAVAGDEVPVPVVRHGIRGTQNVNNDKDREVSNVQLTDTAKLDPRASALVVRFDARFLPLDRAIAACSAGGVDKEAAALAQDLRRSIEGFIAAAGPGIETVARRYARTILNGRWLWRNRSSAERAVVCVAAGGREVRADALSLPLDDFSSCSSDERAVADVIAAGLRGEGAGSLRVSATVDFGVKGAVEVFPSQNYIPEKPKGFARSLYALGAPERWTPEVGQRVMGRAAIRDQKVANALRAFDTWYPDFATHGRAIPVEPNGANLDAQQFFRPQASQASAFKLMLHLDDIDPASADAAYIVACFVRGGVFSEG